MEDKENKKEYSVVELIEKFAKGYGNSGTLLEICGVEERINEQVVSVFKNIYVIEHDYGRYKIPTNKKINILCGDYRKIPMNKYNVIYFDCSMLNQEGLKLYTNAILKRNIIVEPFVLLYTNSNGDIPIFLDGYFGKIYVNVKDKLFAIGINEEMKKNLVNKNG